MNITKEKLGSILNVKLEGRIDANTAGEFAAIVDDELENISVLNLDFADVTYISSIGLRVILEFQKRMNTQGQMILKNVSEPVLEIFKMTGFTAILTIE